MGRNISHTLNYFVSKWQNRVMMKSNVVRVKFIY